MAEITEEVGLPEMHVNGEKMLYCLKGHLLVIQIISSPAASSAPHMGFFL